MLSVDELPQLWCVLKGEMSLVGPRPPLPSEVRRYTPTQLRRLEVKPGITGLWQVCGRSTIPFDGQIALDIEYIRRQSLRFDLDILARTVRAIVSCKGAW
jgi:lipopolysaccharide/colanic/teichoic acid biosynthesis glycosyltransferase